MLDSAARLVVRVAASGNPINDVSQTWRDTRPLLEPWMIEVCKAAQNSDSLQRTLTFARACLSDGIEPSDCPLLEARRSAYSVSY